MPAAVPLRNVLKYVFIKPFTIFDPTNAKLTDDRPSVLIVKNFMMSFWK